MRKPDPTETALDALRRIDDARELAPFFRNRSSAVVARAAVRAAELEGGDLTAELAEAFRRLIEDAAKLDKGCTALTNIATALVKREAAAGEVYCTGIRHIQMEPVWGGSVDTAGPLRAMCAMGLVRMEHPDEMFIVADLLLDQRPEARVGAIRALAESGRPEAELLLRYKARAGDEKTEVTGECFAAVLRIGPPGRALPLIAAFLQAGESDVAEAAALALGESRLTQAFPTLLAAFERHAALGMRAAILWGMALLRNEEAVEFLLRQVAEGQERTAATALEALAAYRGDVNVRDRVKRVMERRGGDVTGNALAQAWRGHWDR